MKELIFSFHLWKVWCPERTDFNIFFVGAVVLKELFLTVSTFGRCGSPEELIFNCFYFGSMWGS